MGSERHGPWTWHGMTRLAHGSRFTAWVDEVTDPAGRYSRYEWVHTPDSVRVAALTDDGRVYLAQQYHYLPRQRMLQAIGGAVDEGEDPRAAAARELAEEAGLTASRWQSFGAVWPLPGLSPARVHLFQARGLQAGPARPEASEADLVITTVPLREAVAAALDGRLGCAASAQLVLAVAATADAP